MTMKPFDPDEDYAMSGKRMRVLTSVAKRLSSASPLKADERRQLAEKIEHCLDSAYPSEQLPAPPWYREGDPE